MKRFLLAIAGLLLVLLGLALHLGPGAAQSAPPAVAGSWRVTVTNSGRAPFTTLSTYGADGTVIVSGAPVSPAPPGASFKLVYASASHGSWVSAGPGAVAVTFVSLHTDEQGRFLGTASVRSTWRLSADGASFEGVFALTIADPSGKTVSTASGTIHGVRIGVEPMGTPLATPGS